MTNPKGAPQAANDDMEQKVSEDHAELVVKLVSGKTGKQAMDVLPNKEGSNLERAIALVNKAFGGRIKVDLNSIIFRELSGNRVGEARAEGEVIDPIMLLHPAVRLAHVIAHELAHQKGEVEAEGMVESYVALFFPEGDLEHSYDAQQVDFRNLAERMKLNESLDRMIEQIYEWYAEEEYEKIYERYDEAYISKLGDEESKNKAFDFFLKVFPELEYKNDGEMDIVDVEKPRAKAA